MIDALDILQQMKVACPVRCKVSMAMDSEDSGNPLILQWNWKSHHYQRTFDWVALLRGIDWDLELAIASKAIRKYIETISKKERQVTNGKEEH